MDRALGARYRGLKLYFAGAGPWRSQRPHNSAEVVRREGLRRIFWQRERSVASIRPAGVRR